LQQLDIRQGVWIYENPNVLPRAYVVHRVEVVSDEGLLERLTSPDLNAWTTALIEEPLPPEQMAGLEGAPLRSTSTARITHYSPNRVEVEADMAAPGLLILSDAYYPGWQVRVDGAPAPLLRANYALRGVYLSAGTHSLVFRFVPIPFWVGLAVAGSTTIFGASFLAWQVHRTRRHVASESNV